MRLRFNTGDVLSSISQNILTILGTRIGSVPLRPDFGNAGLNDLDAPIQENRAQFQQSALEAITQWEPRAKVSAFRISNTEAGLICEVDWTIADTTDTQTTRATL